MFPIAVQVQCWNQHEPGCSRNPALDGWFILATMNPLVPSIWTSHAQLTFLTGEEEGEN